MADHIEGELSCSTRSVPTSFIDLTAVRSRPSVNSGSQHAKPLAIRRHYCTTSDARQSETSNVQACPGHSDEDGRPRNRIDLSAHSTICEFLKDFERSSVTQ